MCGISGIFAYHQVAPEVDLQELRRIRDAMQSRGPDGQGEWYSADQRLGLAHRRLAIIDLSEHGGQPMASQDSNFIITFNGEIYNYQSLRADLERRGHRFFSHSDTEVLLHLYAAHGESMLDKLRGMYAFALWDVKRRALWLVRDPYGIKPLYYADDGWTLRFASQVKALHMGGKVSQLQEPAGIVGFFLFGSVPEPFTLYQEIRAVPAGCSVWVDELGPHAPRRFFSIADIYYRAGQQLRTDDLQDDDVQGLVREALLDSVKHHLVADVSVGAFLSSGVDSGALVGLMKDAGQSDIQTITLRFSEFHGKQEDESPLAADLSAYYGTSHTTRIITEAEFIEDMPEILAAMDQPSIDGINTWFVSKATHELGLKVAISGLGGDELFGGYPAFRDIPRWVGLFGLPSRIPLLGRAARMAGNWLARWGYLNPKAAGLLEYGGSYPGAYLLRRGIYMPWELPVLIGEQTAHEGLRRLAWRQMLTETLSPASGERTMPASSFARVATLEASLYMRNQLLRDTDWASMAHSLEVRVPLVDTVLLKSIASATLKGLSGKKLLGCAPTKNLPNEIVTRKKTGFTTPMLYWQTKLRAKNNNMHILVKKEHWSRHWAGFIYDRFSKYN